MPVIRTLLVLAVAALCCGDGGARYSRKQAQQSLVKLDAPGTTIGEFQVTRIVDGDTIHVDGLDSSLRLLGIDTEETFKSEGDRRAFEAGWPQYAKDKRGAAPRPVKFATPLGEDAKHWAVEFFDGVDKVRLERDHPSEIRDRYNRYLAYVFVERNGAWVNYNVECVRAGMAPYFPKYGRSRRFHQEFLDAEADAKAHQRGIWAPGVMAYPDYPEREAWWTARGDFVDQFRKEAETKPNHVDISHWDALTVLEQQVGKEVVVLGTVDELYIGEKGPTRVMLSHGRGSDFPLIFFDKDAYGASGIGGWKGEFVIATGVPSIYENKHNHRKQVQIVIDRAAQIRLSPVPGLSAPATVGQDGR